MKRVAMLTGAGTMAIAAFIWATATSWDFWNDICKLVFGVTDRLYPVLFLGKCVVALGVLCVLLAVSARLAKQAGVNID
jgi:hypothetical protein